MPTSVAEVTTVGDVTRIVDELWPLAGAEEWDTPGLQSGNPAAKVTSIHLAVDAVRDTVDEAISLGADLLLVHHPLLFRAVTSISEDRYKGALLAALIKANCALIAAHTNADVVENGTSAVFAGRLGLRDVMPIVPTGEGSAVATGIGRVGTLPEPLTLGRLARLIGEILPATASGIRVAGDFDAVVSTVAVCAGAGDQYLAEPAVLAADVYVTSDLRHHPASEARERSGGPALIDVSHWASEWLWLETAAVQLRASLPSTTVTVSELRTDPWEFTVLQ